MSTPLPPAEPPSPQPGAYANPYAGPSPGPPGGPNQPPPLSPAASYRPPGAASGGSPGPTPAAGPGTTLLRVGGIVVVAILVVACTVAVVAGFARQERTETTVYTQDVRVLVADTSTGALQVGTGAPGSDVTVRRTLEWSFGEPRPTAVVDGDRLTLGGDCDRTVAIGGCSISYDVTVPPGTRLTLTSSTGSIEVRGADGDIRATTSTGSVQMSELRSDAVFARASTGEVELDFAVPPTTVDASTSTGSVDVRVPDDGTAYAVDATTSVGERTVQVPVDPRATRTITARASTGSVDVRTGA